MVYKITLNNKLFKTLGVKITATNGENTLNFTGFLQPLRYKNKIYLASTLTGLAAFATVLCLFAMDGISFTTVVAVSAAAFFAKLTVSFFKVENILRAKAAAERKQKMRRNSLRVVNTAKAGRAAA